MNKDKFEIRTKWIGEKGSLKVKLDPRGTLWPYNFTNIEEEFKFVVSIHSFEWLISLWNGNKLIKEVHGTWNPK